MLGALTVHTFHARGVGRSSRPFDRFPAPSFFKGATELEGTLGVGEQLADMERIRQHLGVPKLSLIGHSFGGFLATLYAAEFPERVQSLVLLAPASMLTMPSKDFDFFANVRAGLGSDERRAAFDSFVARYLDFPGLVALDEDKAARTQIEFDSYWSEANPTSPLEGTEDERRALVGGWATYATYLSLGLEYDLRPTLRERFASAHFPTYIVHGGQDSIPVSESRKYVSLFPSDKVTFAVLDSSGHFLPNEEPRPLAALLQDTLTRPTQ
jgi:proline iminopeptidase